jgi:hypothetical protein
VALVVVEAVDGFEAHAEALVLRTALGLIEEQGIAGHAEPMGELAQDLQCRLGFAGFVAAQL